MSDKRPPAGQGWNAPGTCGGGYWRVVNGIYESWPPNPRNTVTMGAGLTMGAVAPSSPTGETEPLAGTTSYTGVIRPADEAEARSSALTEALARIESLWNVIRANGDTNARLMRERDKARGEVVGSERELDRVRAERDAANDRARKAKP